MRKLFGQQVQQLLSLLSQLKLLQYATKLLYLYFNSIIFQSVQINILTACLAKNQKEIKKEISPCSKRHSMVQANNFQINSLFRQLSKNMTTDFFDGLFIFLQNFTYIVSNSKPKLNHLGPKLAPNSNILKNKQSLEISVNQ